MLPKQYRLRSSADIARVRKVGRVYRHPLAILLVARAEPRPFRPQDAGLIEQPITRFAFSASSRVGSAVDRNRGKRVLREAVRARLGQIECGWDCLLIVRKATPRADFAAVQTAVHGLLRRAYLLDDPPCGAQ